MQPLLLKSLLSEVLLRNSSSTSLSNRDQQFPPTHDHTHHTSKSSPFVATIEYILIRGARFKHFIKLLVRDSLSLILQPHLVFRRLFLLLFFRHPEHPPPYTIPCPPSTLNSKLSLLPHSLDHTPPILPHSTTTIPSSHQLQHPDITAEISTSPPPDDETTTTSEVIEFSEDEPTSNTNQNTNNNGSNNSSEPPIDYDALMDAWNNRVLSSENDPIKQRRRQPQMQLVVPTNRKRELDSASQVAKLDFLERHLQLLGDCLTEAKTSHSRPSTNKQGFRQSLPNGPFPSVSRNGSNPPHTISAPYITAAAGSSNGLSPPQFLGEQPVAQPFARLFSSANVQPPQQAPPQPTLRHLPKSEDDDALVSRRYAEDCLRQEHQTPNEQQEFDT